MTSKIKVVCIMNIIAAENGRCGLSCIWKSAECSVES